MSNGKRRVDGYNVVSEEDLEKSIPFKLYVPADGDCDKLRKFDETVVQIFDEWVVSCRGRGTRVRFPRSAALTSIAQIIANVCVAIDSGSKVFYIEMAQPKITQRGLSYRVFKEVFDYMNERMYIHVKPGRQDLKKVGARKVKTKKDSKKTTSRNYVTRVYMGSAANLWFEWAAKNIKFRAGGAKLKKNRLCRKG